MSRAFCSQLPPSWVIAPAFHIAEINPRLNKTEIEDDLEVSFVPMPAVEAETGKIDVSATRRFAEVKKGYTAFREGDVLFAKITPCMENGKMAVAPALKNRLGFGSTEFHVIRPLQGIDSKFLYYFVSSQHFRFDAEHNMTGAVGQRRVPTGYLSGYPIHIPPTNEQHRIVAKIEALFSELDKGVESLKTAREQLKVYRQAVLKHAFEGKLTAQWREENKDKLETPDQLLARIKKEREARYQQQFAEWKAAVKVWEAKGKEGKKPGKPKPPASLAAYSSGEREALGILPEGWGYTRLGELVDEPKYGTSKKCDHDVVGTGVIRIPNVVQGVIDSSDLKYAVFDDEELRTYALMNGDILTIRSNGSVSLVGKCALVASQDESFLYAGYLIRVRPNQQLMLPEYLLSVLSSHSLRSQIEQKAKSTSGVNNINSGELQHLIVPICGLDEQKALMEQLSTALSSLDETEAEIEKQLLRSESLRQSILKKAFSGQLVPQDPNDLPAPRPGKWFVYVLECEDGTLYKGHSRDVLERWKQHATGKGAGWTAKHPPKRLVHWEEFDSEEAAVNREKELKSGYGRKWLEREINAGRTRQAGEPASVLLERIKVEKAAQAKSSKRTKRKKSA